MKCFFSLFLDTCILPRTIERGVEVRYPNEPVLESIKLWRAFYTTNPVDSNEKNQRPLSKVYRFFDRNMFFQTWMIRTSKRIIIAKNSRGFRLFKEIPYEYISNVEYDEDDTHARIYITLNDKKFTLEFVHKHTTAAHELKNKIVAECLKK